MAIQAEKLLQHVLPSQVHCYLPYLKFSGDGV